MWVVQELRMVYNGTFNSTIGFYGRINFRRPQMLPPIFGRWLGETPQGFTLQYQPLIESLAYFWFVHIVVLLRYFFVLYYT